MKIDKKIYSRNSLVLLSYLSKNRSNEFLYGRKIAETIGINQGSASVILKGVSPTFPTKPPLRHKMDMKYDFCLR